jgi:hypothetical protein
VKDYHVDIGKSRWCDVRLCDATLLTETIILAFEIGVISILIMIGRQHTNVTTAQMMSANSSPTKRTVIITAHTVIVTIISTLAARMQLLSWCAIIDYHIQLEWNWNCDIYQLMHLMEEQS